MSVAAILVAAGPGTRLGRGRPKAFVELRDEPLLVHSLRAILGEPAIERIAAVIPPGAEQTTEELLARFGPWRCPVRVVAGGAERQDSVRRGLDCIGDARLVAVHDAARPFVSREALRAAIRAGEDFGAAIVAVPATDTIKEVSEDGWVRSTPERERLWLAQTPQVFHTAILREAHDRAAADGRRATDDAMLVEQAGVRVRVVRGNPENRKITTPEDLRWAEWLLASGSLGASGQIPSA